MPSDFDRIGKQFSQLKFTENSLEFDESLTSIHCTQSGSILTGDLQGKLHHVTIKQNIPINEDRICVSPGTRVSDVTTNLSGNIFALTSFGVDDVTLGEIDSGSCSFGPFSTLQTKDRSLCVSFLEDQRSKQCLLIVGGRRGIRVHDVESGGLFRSFESKSTFTSLHSWNGCMLMAGTLDGEVILWDIRKPQAVASFGKRTFNIGRSIFTLDLTARLLALAVPGGFVEFYDIQSNKLISKKKVIDGHISTIRFSPKQKFLAVADESRLDILNLNDFSLGPQQFPAVEVIKLTKITGLRWCPGNFQFVTRSTDKKLRVFSSVFEDDL